MGGWRGRSIVQEAGWKATHGNSSVRTGKNDRKRGAWKRAALAGDGQRILETTQRGSRAPLPSERHNNKRTPDSSGALEETLGARFRGVACAISAITREALLTFPDRWRLGFGMRMPILHQPLRSVRASLPPHPPRLGLLSPVWTLSRLRSPSGLTKNSVRNARCRSTRTPPLFD